MRKNLWPKGIAGFVLMMAVVQVRAQLPFAYHCTLEGVPQSGFYKIVLQPAIVARCMNGLNDIRILDSKGVQVPYVLKADPAAFHENNFIAFPVLSVNRETDRQTHVVISNPLNRAISELLLVIKNTDAYRTVTISGSDNSNQWFIIKENMPLDNVFSTGDDRFIQSLAFPASRYKYFKIIINGKDLLPVNIVKAGISADSMYQGNYLPVPPPVIMQTDSSNKASYVTLRFNQDYQVDKLELTVTGAKFFNRSAIISKATGGLVQVVAEMALRSGMHMAYPVDVKTRQLTLVIQNEDSPPLRVTSAKVFQRSRYLLTYFEPGTRYRLAFGDANATAPRYDLEFFKDSIGKQPPVVTAGPVVRNGFTAKAPAKPGYFNQKAVLWIIIIAVLGVLLALTLQMTKEVNRKTDA